MTKSELLDGYSDAARDANDAVEIIERLRADKAKLLAAFNAALERMECVAERIPVENRAKGVSQRAHVSHMAGHLAQHAKIARAAIAQAEGGGE